MMHLIDKTALVAEIERRIESCAKQREDMLDVRCYTLADDASARMGELTRIQDFIDTIEVKEVNNIWYDARKTVPEDSTEQIICVKEDGLAIVTMGRIVNGTVKWAYLKGLQNISLSIKAKEVDFSQESYNYFDEFFRVYDDGNKH